MSFQNRSTFSYFLTATLSVLLFFSIEALGKNSLDDHILLSCETKGNINAKLSAGYRAFIVLPDASIDDLLNDAYRLLTREEEAIVSFIFKQSYPGLEEQLKHHQILRYLASPGQDRLDDLAACRQKGKRFFVFAPGKSTFHYPTEDYICDYSVPSNFPSEIEKGFSGNPVNDFVIFKMDLQNHTLTDSLMKQPELVPQLFNTYTGKLPNFFVTDHPDTFFAFKSFWEQYDWFSANVILNKKPLQGISWKEIPEMNSYGKIHTRKNRISPQKSGFRFSPDVFQFNAINSNETKFFYATPKQLTDELVLSLEFNKKIKNSVAGTAETPYCNIEYVKDSKRGWCGLFNGKGHYVDYATGIDIEDNITISVWVNPAEINQNHSIIGKGEAFSVKFKEGKLLFTSPDIMDHFSDSIVVRENEWQHLAFVFSAGKKIRFFRNGLFVGEKKAAEITPTNNSLLIGTNLWDEYFEGMMDDLAIWNRDLSDEEIKQVYKQGLNVDNDTRNHTELFLGLLILIIAGITTYILIGSRRKKEKRMQLHHVNKEPERIISKKELPQIKGPAIQIFGGFQFINRDGEDLTARFSTRRKQLFITVLLATFRKDGISSKQLTDNLWPGYTSESAKNNRSTQIQRLREIFSQNSGVYIDFTNKKWKINFLDDVYCDLVQYFALLDQLKKEEKGNYNNRLLEQLLLVIEKGAVLPQMEEEWLDEFKSKISDELLEYLLPLYQNQDFLANQRLVVRLSDALLIFDPLNESVLKHKVRALLQLGKNTLAHECLEHFSKYYQQCYNQAFETSISELLEEEL